MEPAWLGGHNCQPGFVAELEDVARQLKGFSYRLVKRGDMVGIYEVYYNKDGSVAMWSHEPVSDLNAYFYPTVPDYNPVEDLRDCLQDMLKAFDYPVLIYEELGGSPNN